ncbi:MAG: hypothetical protein Q8L87_19060 [Anaerolineales bacterium]|jgi:hypothetical protein|nr:hypothetical protein [Anaerolineales bacterium]
MKPEITDISYSTALTFELVTQYGFLTLGAPIFPSLRKESIYQTDMNAKSVLLFFQYKLSEHIVGTASSLQDDWGVPYYRFLIHPKNKNKRHEVLLHLEDMNYLAYYVAPEFHTKSGLYESLMQKSLFTHSTFWSPRQIGSLSQAERNTLSYKHNSHFGILEPGKRKIGRALKGEALLSEIKSKFEACSEVYDNEKFVRLGDQMLENYLKVFHTPKEKRLISDIWKSRDRIDARDYLSLISILLYDCYVYIIAK